MGKSSPRTNHLNFSFRRGARILYRFTSGTQAGGTQRGETMYIHEAIKQAMPLGKCIRRRCDDWVQNRLVLYSTTTCEGMILCGHDNLLPRWEPNANDLLADDWEVLPG